MRWSCVMPMYNESLDAERSLRKLRSELDAAGLEAEIVVVDDGSSDGTRGILEGLQEELSLTLVLQENAGRFRARLAGLEASTGEQVVLVDCGVELYPGSLSFLSEQVEPGQGEGRRAWNGDVEVVVVDRYTAFWKVLTQVGWRRYFADRRLVGFAVEEFDAFPKGTTLFSAPREWLLEACREFSPTVGEESLASDDTAVIRRVQARSGRIWIAPGFGCYYRGRSGSRAFAAHARARGTTFVDGYLTDSGEVGRVLRRVLLLVPVLGMVVGGSLLWRARLTLGAGGVLGGVGVGGVVRLALQSGCTRREVEGFLLTLPLFLLTFGSGVVRGLYLAWGHRGQ